MSTINSHKHNGNFQPLLKSFTPEQKQMQKIAIQDKKSGNIKGAQEEWQKIRSTYTQQQRGLSDQAREKSGMPLIDWQPGSGQFSPMKSGASSGSSSPTSSAPSIASGSSGTAPGSPSATSGATPSSPDATSNSLNYSA